GFRHRPGSTKQGLDLIAHASAGQCPRDAFRRPESAPGEWRAARRWDQDGARFEEARKPSSTPVVLEAGCRSPEETRISALDAVPNLPGLERDARLASRRVDEERRV